MTDRTACAGSVRLEPVTARNRSSVLALEVTPEQARFLATNAESLAEARTDGEARPRAILSGDKVVGFLMYDASDDDEALVYRFMIDRRWQGKGYGGAALRAVLDEIGALGTVRVVAICYDPENEGARRLYARTGFVEKGLDEDGEMIAELDLGARR